MGNIMKLAMQALTIVLGIVFGYIGGFFSTVLFFHYLHKSFNPTAITMGVMTIAMLFGICFATSLLIMSITSRFFSFTTLTNYEMLVLIAASYIPASCIIGIAIFYGL